MKGGRLKIVNESSYPNDEVETLVRFGLSEIDLTGQRIVALVKNTRPSKRRLKGQAAYSGLAYSLSNGIPRTLYNRYCGERTHTHHLIIIRVGAPECFPAEAFWRRNGVVTDSYRSWQEALVGVTAHEGKHAEHDHDDAYTEKSGRRKVRVRYRLPGGELVDHSRIVKVRVGAERIEPKCEAFESHMLQRFRAK